MREYILGLRLELARRSLPAESTDAKVLQRNVELASYFTHCQLQPGHLVLVLRLAMTTAYKANCFRTAAALIRRLLELGPPPQVQQVVRIIHKFLLAHVCL